jgi:hypothetical protein
LNIVWIAEVDIKINVDKGNAIVGQGFGAGGKKEQNHTDN